MLDHYGIYQEIFTNQISGHGFYHPYKTGIRMAGEDSTKKWGTIFMRNREASVAELQAMQEPIRREQLQKEQAENYMERVRARAADRARQILGEAYTEKQNVIDEGKKEAAALKKQAAEECARLKGEGEIARKQGQKELEKAIAIREEAERIRDAAREEGFDAAMEEGRLEIQNIQSEMGQSIAVILHALDRQRKNIIRQWLDDLVEVVRRAAMAGTGLVLHESHEEMLKNLVFRALDMLEQHTTVTVKVNPEDEELIDTMFQAARNRYPNLNNWIVKGDDSIEKGGLIAESGSGSVDLRRENFDNMLKNILCHLYLPEDETANAQEIRELVEQEVARIASLTPEPEPAQIIEPEPELEREPVPAVEEPIQSGDTDAPIEDSPLPEEADPVPAAEIQEEQPIMEETVEPALPEEDFLPELEGEPEPGPTVQTAQPSLEELEDELFPVDEPARVASKTEAAPPDPDALAQGGFV